MRACSALLVLLDTLCPELISHSRHGTALSSIAWRHVFYSRGSGAPHALSIAPRLGALLRSGCPLCTFITVLVVCSTQAYSTQSSPALTETVTVDRGTCSSVAPNVRPGMASHFPSPLFPPLSCVKGHALVAGLRTSTQRSTLSEKEEKGPWAASALRSLCHLQCSRAHDIDDGGDENKP